ncbi:MAG: hypothetical protein JWO36_6529 [Myxococcales bacterium]|nr:hypothetical protein [Myxococcales bacterium]
MKLRCKTWLLAVMAGCAARSHGPAIRFANVPAVTVVDDRRDVPAPPENRRFLLNTYYFDQFQRRLTRSLEVHRSQRARGVNALDEVPSSTWFTNRIGARDLTPDELRVGPVTMESPELHKPWTVHSTKPPEIEQRIRITDARGIEFLLKFDTPGIPEAETAAQVIVGRLLWACGYNVPEDTVVYFRPRDLVLARDAVIDDPIGKEPLDGQELERRLAELDKTPDGQLRAVASRWVPGQGVGGFPGEGVRADDPNDRIPHELRRDLRGAYPMFAWLEHGDIQEGNFLDVWVADPRDRRRHYLEHYLIDFGKALGVMAITAHDPRRGHERVVDFPKMAGSFVTLALLARSWEGRYPPALRGVGLFEAASYDPGTWVPDAASYAPLLAADRFDKLWGAKILARFTREQIHAAVEQGRLSDPRAVEYITEVLVARQRATARYWFSQTSPLDRFEATASDGDQTLCFDDLLIASQLATPATRYEITSYDRDQRPIAMRYELAPGARGRTCAPLALAGGFDGYTIVQIVTSRPEFTGTTRVHVARDPSSSTPRVIGVWRL